MDHSPDIRGFEDLASLSGRTGGGRIPRLPLVSMLSYVAGYVSKASDALKCNPAETTYSSEWFQVYRMLANTTPLIPEKGFEMATLPQIHTS